MQLGEVVTTIPTIGFNVETVRVCSVADAILAQFHLLLPQVNFRSTDFIIWDVGGADKIRPLWQHYVNADTACLCWWIDCNDRDRLAESIEEL